MGKLDEASFRAASGRRYDCRVGAILRALDDEDRATLERVLSDPTVSNTGICTVLTANGHFVGQTSVQKHRTRVCQCQA